MNLNETDEPIELGEPDELPMYNQAVNKIEQFESQIADAQDTENRLGIKLAECVADYESLEAENVRLRDELERCREMYKRDC